MLDFGPALTKTGGAGDLPGWKVFGRPFASFHAQAVGSQYFALTQPVLRRMAVAIGVRDDGRGMDIQPALTNRFRQA